MSRSDFVRRVLSRRRSAGEQIAWSIVLALVPVVVRWAIDNGTVGIPFTTYWPCLLIAALILDPPFAIAVAVGAAALVQNILGGGPWFAEITPVRMVIFAIFAGSSALILVAGAMLRGAMRQMVELSEQQEVFNRELRHRVRNILAIIQVLASRGPKAESPVAFFRDFSARLESLAKASDLLQIGAYTEGRLPDLAEQTVQPFVTEGRIHLSGPPCMLPNDSCIPLIMAIHELCTNAGKHGALSVESGHVELRWFLAADGTTLYILWKERGGPRVEPPDDEGFGTRLLAAQPGINAAELGFDPGGLWCELRVDGARPIPAE